MQRVTGRLVFAFLIALLTLASSGARAANVQFGGSVGYSYSGNSAVLTADRIENYTAGGTSGTLRMELWVFSTPYTGSQSGYKLAQYQLGQLQGGYYYYSINSGSVAFSYPPNGTWYPTMFVTEYDGASSNNGYSVRDWANLSPTIQVGPVAPAPGQIVVPSAYNFGTQTVGTSSSPRTFTLSNVGGTAVSLTGLTSSLPGEFSVNTGNCGYINAGASCSFTIC